MSSQLTITKTRYILPAESLSSEIGEKLHKAAGESLKKKLATGEIKLVNGRYVGETLKVNTASSIRMKLRGSFSG